MGKRVGLILSIAAVAAMCAFIFYMSSFPADESAELSMGVVWHIIGFIVPGYDQMSPADQLYWQQALDHPVRKTAHFLEYAALGALTMNALWQIVEARHSESGSLAKASESRRSAVDAEGHAPENRALTVAIQGRAPKLRNLAIGAWAFATAYAVADEVHQMFVPGRAGMATDVLLDSAGVLVGVAIVALVLRRIIRKRQIP